MEENIVSKKIDNLLLRDRVIQLTGSINTEVVESVISQMSDLQADSSEPIKLVLDSRGGAILPALKLYDFISYFLKAPVHGIVSGSCGSSATFIFMACKDRKSFPHARFLIHSGQINPPSITIDDDTENVMQQFFKEGKVLNERTINIYCGSLGLARDKVKELIKRGDQICDAWFTAEEAMEINFIESIITEKLNLFNSI